MPQHVEIESRDRLSAPLAWFGLGIVVLCLAVFGLVFQFLPPLLPRLMTLLAISHGQAGLLMSVFALPGIVLSIPSGQLVDRFGTRAVGVTGLVSMALGTAAMALPESFGLLLTARALAGAGGMVAVVTLQRSVTLLFTGRPLGLPMGVATTAIPLGVISGLNLAGPLAESLGWRGLTAVVGATVAVAALAFAAMTSRLRAQLGASPPAPETAELPAVAPAASREGSPARKYARGSNRKPAGSAGLGAPVAIWLVGGVWFCANGAMNAFVTFAPDFLRDLELSLAERGFLTSLPMIASAGLAPLVGWLLDRRGGRAEFLAAGMFMMAVLLALVPRGLLAPAVAAVGLGVAMAGIVTPVLSSPAELLPAYRHGYAFGILSACANVGIFGVPPLAGYVRTLTGNYVWPFQVMAAVALVGAAMALVLRAGRYTRRFAS